MLNERTWKTFKSLQKTSKRKVIVESHIRFLETCKNKDLVPFGMKYKPKVRFKSQNDRKEYLNMLSKTSKSTLRMAYKAFKNEGNNLKVRIQQDEKNLRATANNYEYNFVINKVKKNCDHVRNKIKKVKERKLINLEEKQRLVNNNGNEKQVENENGNFKHKRNRRKINNKRKRSA